jgi:hypothetical protein
MHSRWLPHEAGWKNAECAKMSSRQRVATLKNPKYKIYFDLFNTFLVTTWFHLCYFIVLMISLLFYNVEIVQIKKKRGMSRCFQTFDWYCIHKQIIIIIIKHLVFWVSFLIIMTWKQCIWSVHVPAPEAQVPLLCASEVSSEKLKVFILEIVLTYTNVIYPNSKSNSLRKNNMVTVVGFILIADFLYFSKVPIGSLISDVFM